MHVHLAILDASGSLAHLGSDQLDRIVLRTLPEPSQLGKTDSTTQEMVLEAPYTADKGIPITLSKEISDAIKNELTKRPKHRALNKYLLQGIVTRRGQLLGAVSAQLLCLANGYVVERWIKLKPAEGIEAGALRVRIVMRDSEAAALTVFKQTKSVEPNDMSRTEACECDVCDPNGDQMELNANHARARSEKRRDVAIGFVLATCAIS